MFTLVARGPQGYKVVWYNAFRYLDLKEGSDGAHDHLIASVKPFQTFPAGTVRTMYVHCTNCTYNVRTVPAGLGPEYEMHFWPIDLLHFGRVSSEEVAFRVP